MTGRRVKREDAPGFGYAHVILDTDEPGTCQDCGPKNKKCRRLKVEVRGGKDDGKVYWAGQCHFKVEESKPNLGKQLKGLAKKIRQVPKQPTTNVQKLIDFAKLRGLEQVLTYTKNEGKIEHSGGRVYTHDSDKSKFPFKYEIDLGDEARVSGAAATPMQAAKAVAHHLRIRVAIEEFKDWAIEELGLCGCGEPWLVIQKVYDLLIVMEQWRNKPGAFVSLTTRRRKLEKILAMKEQPALAFSFLYMLNDNDMIEHGGNILTAWISDKGIEFLRRYEQRKPT